MKNIVAAIIATHIAQTNTGAAQAGARRQPPGGEGGLSFMSHSFMLPPSLAGSVYRSVIGRPPYHHRLEDRPKAVGA
jgi:hypothetical protein